MNKAITPVVTIGGKILYRTGEGLEFIGNRGAKKVGDIIENPKAGLSIKPVGEWSAIPEGDRKFLTRFIEKVSNKTVSEKDIKLVQDIFKENGLSVPNTTKRLADQIKLISESAEQRIVDTQLDTRLGNQ